MKIEEIPIPLYLKENLLKDGIEELYPPQEEAIKKGVLEGENLVLATPTASGKTLVAIFATAKHLENNGKVLYLTPLRALAAEKYNEFKKYFGNKASIIATYGDYDSSDPWLSKYDIIITTNEKADSLLRHGANWIRNISLIVVDEIHLLGDPERGPTLEMTVTKILETVPNAQILSLSATINNAEEIANWLKSKLININWRPVPLKEGVYYDESIEFSDEDIEEVHFKDFDPVINIALETIIKKGQALIFTTTRRKAEKIAEKAAKALSKMNSKSSLKEEILQQYAEKILEIGGKAAYAEKLAFVIKRGAAYHHAGLSHPYRTIIEEAFRKKHIKILAATPTLAAGVNLPARTVIIPEFWRYSPEVGFYGIPVLEYKQYCGRAGRPRYDKIGYAISIARRRIEKELIFNKYINGEIEKIWSRLSDERHLRMHLLAIIASNYANNIQEILQFFEKTFFAKQYGLIGVKEKIHSIIGFLNDNKLIEINKEEIKATKLGKRVSELYIDPLTAIILVNGLRYKSKILSDISILHLISKTPDVPMISGIRIPMEKLELYYQLHKNELLIEAPDPEEDPFEYEIYLEDFKKVMVLESWINELSEGEIYERYRVEPGDLAVLRETAEWVIYSAHEISKIINEKDKVPLLRELIERVKHGIKSELIPLTRLEGIGRVRARALYQVGFKTIEELSKAPLNVLINVPTIGLKTALLIKKQVGGKIDKKFLENEKDFEQTNLSSY